MTEAEFDQHLLNIGLLSQLPDTAADYDDPDDVPVKIKGEPLSETIIRDAPLTMADYFFETSALVKRHVDERGFRSA